MSNWWIMGEWGEPLEVLYEIYRSIPASSPQGDSLPQLISSMLPAEQTIEDLGFTKAQEYTSVEVQGSDEDVEVRSGNTDPDDAMHRAPTRAPDDPAVAPDPA